ncbi:protein preY, mitochondrial [Cocos nucifera]|uniref:Protein preY, mitochondrial n=1 Tax=Cocos nucifera TaxID=13894 RepID=A0A8K0IMS8_COCNU|nr:protein preY, mitochondrial [Cocos nucifera]
MVGGSGLLLKDAGNISKALSDFLVCLLSKQPLRHFEDSQSLISETIGVSFPSLAVPMYNIYDGMKGRIISVALIIDGIPCLVPKDGKLIEEQDKSQIENGADPSSADSKR